MRRSAQRRMARTTPCSGGVPGGHARPEGPVGGPTTRGADPVLSERELSAAIGSAAYGPDGEKIGTVEHFFTDDRTGAPTWVAVSTGLFGTRHSIVPATQATFADGVLRVPVSKDAVRHAPAVGGDHLGPDEEAELRRHYGLDSGLDRGLDSGTDTGVDSGTGTGLGTGTDGPATPATGERPADDAY